MGSRTEDRVLGDLPWRLEDLGPEWLSGALSGRHAGVRVESVELLAHQHGTNRNGRLRLHYAAGSTGPETLFVKLARAGSLEPIGVQLGRAGLDRHHEGVEEHRLVAQHPDTLVEAKPSL